MIVKAPPELMEMLWAGMESAAIADSLQNRGITHLAVDMFLTSINVSPELSEDESRQWREFVSFGLNPLLFRNWLVAEIFECQRSVRVNLKVHCEVSGNR
ncbi:MAG: hypothetical protein GQ565_02705 [Candidatus Aegiribacteria sp.]|nr:hypothetical protein [Candidatus Aegiribacteria sp.]